MQRIMNELKVKNWKLHLHQQLNDDDPDRKKQLFILMRLFLLEIFAKKYPKYKHFDKSTKN